MRRRALLVLTAGVALAGARGAAAQGRVPVVTRLVKALLDAETRLAQAAAAGDAAALGRLLADDFEQRSAARPGVPTPRAEWLAALAREPAPAAQIEQIAVHEHGSVAVASFLLQPDAPASSRAPALFVVDTWSPAGDAWQLKVRYVAPVVQGAGRVPGDAPPPPLPKR